MQNQALLHDITRASLVTKGYTGPIITPESAADHLVQLATQYDYTLFEYFLTDQAGHSGSMEIASAILRTLDAFLAVVFPLALDMGISVAMTSDHGNIESLSKKGHTCNMVPLIAVGDGSDKLLSSCKTLTDISPVILENINAKHL